MGPDQPDSAVYPVLLILCLFEIGIEVRLVGLSICRLDCLVAVQSTRTTSNVLHSCLKQNIYTVLIYPRSEGIGLLLMSKSRSLSKSKSLSKSGTRAFLRVDNLE